jgi:hypothetical protein
MAGACQKVITLANIVGAFQGLRSTEKMALCAFASGPDLVLLASSGAPFSVPQTSRDH